MRNSEKKRPRILFGVPEGEYYARQFGYLAAALPEAECRFVGLSWSTGRDLRKRKLDFVHMPWHEIGYSIPILMPPVAEFTALGYRQDSVPLSGRRALGQLTALIEREVEAFAPDLVVYGPIDHAVCYLMDQAAKERGVQRIGILPCFLSDHFIVQSEGNDWETVLRHEQIPERHGDSSLDNVMLASRPKIRLIGKSSTIWKVSLWIRGVEYLLRVLGGSTGLHTLRSLTALFVSKAAPPKWFPDFPTLESGEQVSSGGGFVLVALNQPGMSWTQPTWIDLIEFALASAPEEVLIIIRPHPSEIARAIPRELASALHERGVRISRAGRGPSLATLLKHCRAVITLTSAVGVEALLAGTPVFALAPAFYARPGLAHAVTPADAPRVREMLMSAEQCRPDMPAVNQFIGWLLSERVVPSPETDSTGKESLAERIRGSIIQAGTIRK